MSETVTRESHLGDAAKNALVALPRITIKFCTQCRWMLRAAYFAQELLSTFSTSLGEVALIPSTGGVFTVDISFSATSGQGLESSSIAHETVATRTLWDRKTDGGFPETKELKKRVRDIIDPGRDLGHVDGKKSVPSRTTADASTLGDSAQMRMESISAAAVGKDGEKDEEIKRNLQGLRCEDCD